MLRPGIWFPKYGSVAGLTAPGKRVPPDETGGIAVKPPPGVVTGRVPGLGLMGVPGDGVRSGGIEAPEHSGGTQGVGRGPEPALIFLSWQLTSGLSLGGL